ncbi:MAG: hypothetical protein ABEJ90_01370 [Halobacterium sp.]
MTRGRSPTEAYDGRITVHLLFDRAENEAVRCSSYEGAIDVVRRRGSEAAVAKIVDRDDDVVFRSDEMDIDVWESVWRTEKRRLDADVEERDCPYDSVSCFADDLCVQCQIDEVRDQY